MRKYRKPHRIKKKKPFFKQKYFWTGFFGFVFSVLAIYLLIFSQYFQIENIIISGNEKTKKNEILNIIENKIQKTIFFSSTKSIYLANITEIKKQALNDFPQINDLEISKSFPNSLNVIVIERFGVAVFCQDIEKEDEIVEEDKSSSTEFPKETKVEKKFISLSSADVRCFLIDQKGVVFEEISKDTEFLKIKKPSIKNELTLGQTAVEHDLFSKILKIFSVLAELDIKAKKVLIVSSDRINVLTAENWEIYFDPQKDLSWQLEKLEALLKEHVSLENRNQLDYVELRFGDLAPFKYKE